MCRVIVRRILDIVNLIHRLLRSSGECWCFCFSTQLTQVESHFKLSLACVHRCPNSSLILNLCCAALNLPHGNIISGSTWNLERFTHGIREPPPPAPSLADFPLTPWWAALVVWAPFPDSSGQKDEQVFYWSFNCLWLATSWLQATLKAKPPAPKWETHLHVSHLSKFQLLPTVCLILSLFRILT